MHFSPARYVLRVLGTCDRVLLIAFRFFAFVVEYALVLRGGLVPPLRMIVMCASHTWIGECPCSTHAKSLVSVLRGGLVPPPRMTIRCTSRIDW